MGTTGASYTTREYLSWYIKDDINGKVDQLHSYLCDDFDVMPSGYMLSGAQAATYYSYMNMFNPMPCAEVLVSNVYESLVTNGITLLADSAPFVPHETFAECTESYLGTLKAYYSTYLASDLEGFRGAKDWQTGYLEHSTFVLAWGLMYVHLTYPSYPLCTGYRNKGYGFLGFMGGDSTDPANDFVQIIKEHLPGFTPGTGSGGYGPYNWQSSNQPSFKAMYGDMADFWGDQL